MLSIDILHESPLGTIRFRQLVSKFVDSVGLLDLDEQDFIFDETEFAQ
jgi:hypothetical protein